MLNNIVAHKIQHNSLLPDQNGMPGSYLQQTDAASEWKELISRPELMTLRDVLRNNLRDLMQVPDNADSKREQYQIKVGGNIFEIRRTAKVLINGTSHKEVKRFFREFLNSHFSKAERQEIKQVKQKGLIAPPPEYDAEKRSAINKRAIANSHPIPRDGNWVQADQGQRGESSATNTQSLNIQAEIDAIKLTCNSIEDIKKVLLNISHLFGNFQQGLNTTDGKLDALQKEVSNLKDRVDASVNDSKTDLSSIKILVQETQRSLSDLLTRIRGLEAGALTTEQKTKLLVFSEGPHSVIAKLEFAMNGIANLENKMGTADQNIRNLRTSLTQVTQDAAKAQATATAAQNSATNAGSNADKAIATANNAQATLHGVQGQLTNLKTQVTTLEAALKIAQDASEKTNADLAIAKEQLAQAIKNSNGTSDLGIRAAEDTANEAKKAANAAEAKVETLRTQVTELQVQINALTEKAAAVEKEAKVAQTTADHANREAAAAVTKVTAVECAVNSANEKIAVIQTELENFRNQLSWDRTNILELWDRILALESRSTEIHNTVQDALNKANEAKTVAEKAAETASQALTNIQELLTQVQVKAKEAQDAADRANAAEAKAKSHADRAESAANRAEESEKRIQAATSRSSDSNPQIAQKTGHLLNNKSGKIDGKVLSNYQGIYQAGNRTASYNEFGDVESAATVASENRIQAQLAGTPSSVLSDNTIGKASQVGHSARVLSGWKMEETKSVEPGGTPVSVLSDNKIGKVGNNARVLSDWQVDGGESFGSGNIIGDIGDGAMFGQALTE